MLRTYYTPHILEAGCDEAGRGCLAGPVYAAAVILPPDFNHPKLDDSKNLTAEVRNELRIIIEKEAVDWHVSRVKHTTIDKINILNASIRAMNLAVHGLKVHPDQLLIDGNRFHTQLNIPYQCVIGGDGIFKSIAAASILAKTHRDEYMVKLHEQYPYYNWKSNKGYPTKEHRRGIEAMGPSPYHRMTFRLLPEKQLRLELDDA